VIKIKNKSGTNVRLRAKHFYTRSCQTFLFYVQRSVILDQRIKYVYVFILHMHLTMWPNSRITKPTKNSNKSIFRHHNLISHITITSKIV